MIYPNFRERYPNKLIFIVIIGCTIGSLSFATGTNFGICFLFYGGNFTELSLSVSAISTGIIFIILYSGIFIEAISELFGCITFYTPPLMAFRSKRRRKYIRPHIFTSILWTQKKRDYASLVLIKNALQELITTSKTNQNIEKIIRQSPLCDPKFMKNSALPQGIQKDFLKKLSHTHQDF